MNKTGDKMVSSHFTPINDDNPEMDRVVAELRLYTGDISPEEATKGLQVMPTETIRKGAPVKPDSDRKYKLNGWFLTSEGEVSSKDIRRHLDWLISRLRPARDALLVLQNETGVRMFVSCAIWTRGRGGSATLWPEHMKALADLNLECSFAFADYDEPES